MAIQNIVRTIYSSYIQTCQYMGLPFTVAPNSTLNTKFNIHADVDIPSSTIPTVKYICIGNGGHKMTVGSDNIPLIEVLQHTPKHGALFNHLPFVLRLPTDDLTAVQRLNYRLRRLEVHDGVTYVAYYAKILDFTDTVAGMEYKTVTDGVTYTTDFVPTAADLTPTPPVVNNTGVVETTGDYLSSTAKVPFVMSADDVTEFLNVANIIYGDDRYAIISEMALCTGVDKVVTGDFNGVSSSYTDAIGVQVANFIARFYSMRSSQTGLKLLFDLGSVEPLLVTG